MFESVRWSTTVEVLPGLLHRLKNWMVKVKLLTVLPLQKAAKSTWHDPPSVQLVSVAGGTPPPKTHGADGVQNLTAVSGGFVAGPKSGIGSNATPVGLALAFGEAVGCGLVLAC